MFDGLGGSGVIGKALEDDGVLREVEQGVAAAEAKVDDLDENVEREWKTISELLRTSYSAILVWPRTSGRRFQQCQATADEERWARTKPGRSPTQVNGCSSGESVEAAADLSPSSRRTSSVG